MVSVGRDAIPAGAIIRVESRPSSTKGCIFAHFLRFEVGVRADIVAWWRNNSTLSFYQGNKSATEDAQHF